MFENTTLIQQNLQHIANGHGHSQTRYHAVQAFWQAYFQASLYALWASVRGRASHLESMPKEVYRRGNGRRLSGIQLIPLNQIRGSEGRNHDFDTAFRPRQAHTLDRWVHIAVAHAQGISLPPVDLIQVGHTYYVRDGHHRISVAHARGQAEIEAQLSRW